MAACVPLSPQALGHRDFDACVAVLTQNHNWAVLWALTARAEIWWALSAPTYRRLLEEAVKANQVGLLTRGLDSNNMVHSADLARLAQLAALAGSALCLQHLVSVHGWTLLQEGLVPALTNVVRHSSQALAVLRAVQPHFVDYLRCLIQKPDKAAFCCAVQLAQSKPESCLLSAENKDNLITFALRGQAFDFAELLWGVLPEEHRTKCHANYLTRGLPSSWRTQAVELLTAAPEPQPLAAAAQSQEAAADLAAYFLESVNRAN